jgi:hypothetical protein
MKMDWGMLKRLAGLSIFGGRRAKEVKRPKKPEFQFDSAMIRNLLPDIVGNDPDRLQYSSAIDDSEAAGHENFRLSEEKIDEMLRSAIDIPLAA